MQVRTPSSESKGRGDGGRGGNGRDRAIALARGVGAWLVDQDFQPLTEFTLRTGRRVDVIGVGRGGDIWVVEIKTTAADLRADAKWPEYRPFCDRLFFAVPEDFDLALLPPDTGVLVADGHAAALARPAPEHRVNGSRRRALMLRLARVGAGRLNRLLAQTASGAPSWNDEALDE